jgi:hypothetical protein
MYGSSGIRLACLIASATTAGYFWRVALEDDGALQRLLDTSPPRAVAPGPSTPRPGRQLPTVFLPDRTASPKSSGGSVAPRKRDVGARRVDRSSKRLGSRARPAPQSDTVAGTRSKVAPVGEVASLRSQDRPAGASPTSPGSATRKPPAAAGPRAGKPDAKPDTPKAPKTPKPETPEPAGEAGNVETVPQAENPPPKQQAPKPEETPSTEEHQDQRPGWGKGDKNHEHTGPPGKSK